MANAFDDLIPAQPAAADPFADLVPRRARADFGNVQARSDTVPLGLDVTALPDALPEYDSAGRVLRANPFAPLGSRPETANPLEGARARVYDLVASGVRGIANIGERLGDRLETAIPISGLTPEQIANEQQLAPLFRFSDYLRGEADRVNYQPAVELPAVKDALSQPLGGLGDAVDRLGTVGRFAFDQAVTSTPDMAAAAAALPAYVLGRTQEIGERRVANDAREGEPTLGDLAAAAPAAVIESTLERFATRGLGQSVAPTVAGRVLRELGVQTGTEAAEEAISNLGESLGTERGVSAQELGDAALAGALGGVTVGGAGALGGEALRAVRSRPEAVAAAKAEFDDAARANPQAWEQAAAAAAERHGVTPAEILTTPDVAVPPEPADDLDALLLRNVLGDEPAEAAPDGAIDPAILAAGNAALAEPLGGPTPEPPPADADARWRRPEPAAPPARAPALPASSPVTAEAPQPSTAPAAGTPPAPSPRPAEPPRGQTSVDPARVAATMRQEGMERGAMERRAADAAELQRGREAMQRVITEHADVQQAMSRPGLGPVSFYWGKEGNPAKNFAGGEGVAKIIAKREAEGADGEAVARHMVDVIANGQVGEEYGPTGAERVNITMGDATAVLSKYRFGDRETWLLTGWSEKSGGGEGVTPVPAYAPEPSGIQAQPGADSAPQPEGGGTPGSVAQPQDSAQDDTPDPPTPILYGRRRGAQVEAGQPSARAQARVDRMFAERQQSPGAEDATAAGGAPDEGLESTDRAAAFDSLQRGEEDAELLGLRQAVNAALGEAGERVIYLRGIEGLPERLQRGIRRRLEQRAGRGRAAAIYDPAERQVYLFTDVVQDPKAAVFNAAHEIAGHHGLRELLGDQLNGALEIALQNPTVKAVADAVAAQRNLRPTQRLLAAEEALAELAAAVRTGDFDAIEQRYSVPVPEGIRASLARAVDNFLRRLKALLDRAFGRTFTDQDVRALLEAAWQAAQGEPSASVQMPDGSAVLEQAAFHGTPHTVDRFSLQKIGTGEGAQAYGWGLYFASRREVADSYRRRLSAPSIDPANLRAAPIGSTADKLVRKFAQFRFLDESDLNDAGISPDNVPLDGNGEISTSEFIELGYAADSSAEVDGGGYLFGFEDGSAIYERDGEIKAVMPKQGNLYQVEIPEDSDLLDWDAPLSEQPEKVREALAPLLSVTRDDVRAAMQGEGQFGWLGATTLAAIERGDVRTGSELYEYLSSGEARAREASEFLNSLGIPGLRYLDGGSRGAGEGSHNYVIWDEAAIGEPDALESVAPDQTDTPEFRRWFGDSKVVDENGKPLVVYHGAPDARFMEADATFMSLRDRYGERRGVGAFWFARDRSTAASYADDRRAFDYQNAEPDIIPAYLKLENPLIVDGGGKEWREAQAIGKATDVIEKAQAEGHDGVIIRNVRDNYINGPRTRPTDTYVVFDSRQIKSATANRGTFDPESPSILESVEYTPEQAAALEKAGLRVDRRTRIDRVRDRLREEWQKVREAARNRDALKQAMFDRFHGLRAAEAQIGLTDAEQSPYLAARMSAGVPAQMEALMLYGAPKWDGGVLGIDGNTVGLLDALKPVRDHLDEWLGWMVGRRAQLLKQQGREHNLTDGDIKALLSLADGREAEFKRAAADYLKIKNAVLDVAEQAGLIDPVARAAWDHAEYIPFYRQEGDRAIGPGTRRGLEGQSSGIRTLKGGEAALHDPLSNIVRNFSKLVDAANKNRAMLLAVDGLGAKFFEPAPREMQPASIPLDQVKRHLREQGVDEATINAMPPAALKGVQRMLSIVPPRGEDVVRVMREGKPEYFRVLDPLVLRALTAFREQSKGAAIKPFIWFKRLLTTGVTTTAEFVGANFIRDSGSAWVISDDRFRPGWDSLAGAAKTLANDQGTREMMMAGATFMGGNFYDGNADAAAAALRRALRKKGIRDRDLEGFMSTVARSPLHLWDAWMRLSSAIENANRRAVYDAAIRSGRSKTEAAYMARDLMDFSMQGDAAWVQFFSDVLPFFNARLQGLYKLGRRAGTKDGRRAIILRGGVLALASAALYAWNMAMYGDAYDDLEEWDKDAYWHIAPGTEYHTRIPKPFELGLIFGTAVERGLQAMRQATTGEGDKPSTTWEALVRALTGTLAMNPIPQAALPVVEQWANKRFFTDRAIENMGDEKLLPEARAEWYTSDTAKAISSLVGNETGLSPKRIEHLWNGYTAGLGGYVLDASDAVVRMVQDAPERPEMAKKDWPILGRFLRGGSPGGTKYTEQFYDTLRQAEQVEQTIKEYVIAGRASDALKLERENRELLGERVKNKRAKGGFQFARPKALRKVRTQLSGIREEMEGVALSRQMSDHEKRVKLDELTAERNRLVKQAVLTP